MRLLNSSSRTRYDFVVEILCLDYQINIQIFDIDITKDLFCMLEINE